MYVHTNTLVKPLNSYIFHLFPKESLYGFKWFILIFMDIYFPLPMIGILEHFRTEQVFCQSMSA